MRDRVRALFLREERPNAAATLTQRGDENAAALQRLIANSLLIPIPIFAPDGAVIGGREAVKAAGNLASEDFTDIVIDCSALSRGVVFPIVRYMLGIAAGRNVHLMVIDEPATDDDIFTVAWEQAGYIHGFKGAPQEANNPQAAKLWLPQLVPNQSTALDRIYRFIDPHDVCPILPFPASHPRDPDALLEQYGTELQTVWRVDPRSVVYADQGNPLDLYRAIVRIGEARRNIFASTIGSRIVLSPIGSKVLGLGALMAAIDRDFPVAYVEAVAYKVEPEQLDNRAEPGPVVHLWLEGEAYATS